MPETLIVGGGFAGVMQSCQHALPQGKFAGHNAAADLVRFEPVP